MPDITDSFQELKRLFDAECAAVERIKKECHEVKVRPTAAYVITKLLHGFNVREAYRAVEIARDLIGDACEDTKLDASKIQPTFTY